MKWFVLILLILLFLAGGYYLFYAQKNPSANTVNESIEDEKLVQTVYIRDTEIDPETVTIKVGSELKFTNSDDVDHTIIGDGGIDSGELGPGENYKQTFDNKGEYQFRCIDKTSLTGEIIVE